MASLSKSKLLFGTTSPRTLEKIIPEIALLTKSFSGKKWTGNSKLQADFFSALSQSDYYQGSKLPLDPALAARDRITRSPKALGFIDLDPKINLTEAGEALLSGKRADEVYTKQLLKFQLPSPYHTQSSKIEFKVKPYLELIRLIHDLKSLSKTEIALFFTQLTSTDKYGLIIKKVEDFRASSKAFKGSRKLYVSVCFETEIKNIYAAEIAQGLLKTRESPEVSIKKFISTKAKNMKDYADAFSRYVRATELIAFQRKTYRLIISPQKTQEVSYILNNTKREPVQFSNTLEFKNYLFSLSSITLLSDDKELLLQKITKIDSSKANQNLDIEELKDILFNLEEQIKLSNIENTKADLKSQTALPDIIEVFEQIKKKEIPDPSLFLEWNVWRALVMLNYAKKIDGNFIVDIDGTPINYAPGNKPDIEAEYEDFGVITEVTMSSGNTQFTMEGESVPRHFGRAKASLGKEMYCLFIAPKISDGTLAHYFNLNKSHTNYYGGKTKIIPLSIEQFIEFITVGDCQGFNNPAKLQGWLEERWSINQTCNDEDEWYAQIKSGIKLWAA